MADHIHRNSLKPGYKLHWYRIESVLGQGGFGLTYLAFDFNLDQQVAIKEYLPIELAVRERDFSVHPASGQTGEKYKWGLDRFIAEARTLARFKHPNIVRVINVFEANNTAYMVMEYEHGESLQDILSRRKILEEEELMNLLIPVLGGLQKVHDTGFIHRDIKPGNIFLRKDGSPVLLDFGSARQALGVATQTLTSLVSPGYTPFEQYYSKSDQQGPWTDIYSLGATLYRAISGLAPMDSLDRSGAILKTGKDVLVPAMEVGQGRYSERVLRAIDHALQFKEEDRPQSIDKWRGEFSVAGSSVTFSHSLPSEAPTAIPTHSPPAATNARAKLPHMRRIIGTLLVMAVLAGSGIGYTWWREEQARQQRELAEKKVAMAEISLAEGDLAGARTYLLEGAAADPQAPSLNAARSKVAEAAKVREDQISALLKKEDTAAEKPDGQAAQAEQKAADKTAVVEEKAADKTVEVEAKRNLDKEEAARVAAIVGDFLDIPGGTFSMGCSQGDAECDADEMPPHTVTVKPFRMGKHEVTFIQWDACVVAGGCDQKPNDQGWGRRTRPVINVNWDDARQFVAWASRKTGRTLRLPTEAEWEYAARAGSTSKYPWGNTITHENANYGSDICCTGKAEGHDEWINTAPVGSFPSNTFGLHDMTGNVLEWTQDCWNDSYNKAPTDGSAWTVGDCGMRVIRSGSWGYFPSSVRSSSRDGGAAAGRGNELGFRLVQEL